MLRTLLKSKIHRATVTDADLNYEGSISIDIVLMKAANLVPNELVHVWDVTNGNRFETYVIEGDSGVICVNGAAARLVQKGDLLIVTSFAQIEESKVLKFQPSIVMVDEDNQSRLTPKKGKSKGTASKREEILDL